MANWHTGIESIGLPRRIYQKSGLRGAKISRLRRIFVYLQQGWQKFAI